jgi:hypothetical protein
MFAEFADTEFPIAQKFQDVYSQRLREGVKPGNNLR